jgi:hypothetical protein
LTVKNITFEICIISQDILSDIASCETAAPVVKCNHCQKELEEDQIIELWESRPVKKEVGRWK